MEKLHKEKDEIVGAAEQKIQDLEAKVKADIAQVKKEMEQALAIVEGEKTALIAS